MWDSYQSSYSWSLIWRCEWPRHMADWRRVRSYMPSETIHWWSKRRATRNIWDSWFRARLIINRWLFYPHQLSIILIFRWVYLILLIVVISGCICSLSMQLDSLPFLPSIFSHFVRTIFYFDLTLCYGVCWRKYSSLSPRWDVCI